MSELLKPIYQVTKIESNYLNIQGFNNTKQSGIKVVSQHI